MAKWTAQTIQKEKVQLFGRQTIPPCLVLPYGSRCSPVKIDGDLYLPTIMTEPFLANFIVERQADKDLDQWLGSSSEGTSYLCILGASQTSFSFSLSDGHTPSNYAEATPWPWRPVLIPLTKNLKPDSVLRQYKNGEFVKAGTLVFCGDKFDRTIKIKPHGLSTAITAISLNRIKFSDSDGANDLEWMAWNGVLVATQNILTCTTNTLAKLHLATYFDTEGFVNGT